MHSTDTRTKARPRQFCAGGYGFFYDRFQTSSLMSLERFNNNGNSQTQTASPNPHVSTPPA